MPAETDAAVLVEREGGIAVVTLNRPKNLNALSIVLMRDLWAALSQLSSDSKIGCVVLTGGFRAFAAGADLGEMKDLESSGKARAALADYLGTWDRIAEIPTPIVAAVSGFALGGGLELALACDFIVAGENSSFGQPEIRVGLIPGAGGTQRLARAVGRALASDMVLTGRRINATQALAAGLISRVFLDEGLIFEARKIAHEISALSRSAARAAKTALRASDKLPVDAGLRQERDLFYGLFDGADAREGMKAFFEKRPARYKPS